jgi:GT2 family glycosyltransferase
VIAFTDDDGRVRAGWADALAAAFDDPAVAFVTGAIRAGEGAPADGPVPRMHEDRSFVLDPARRGALGASANLAVRRTALDAVGGFDDDLGPGRWFRAAEDIDLFDRLFLVGARGLYEPLACIEHNQWRDRRAMLRLDYGYGLGMGARLARLWRTDRRRARWQTADLLWTHGLRVAWSELIAGHQLAAAGGLLRFAGTVVALPLAVVRLPARPRR